MLLCHKMSPELSNKATAYEAHYYERRALSYIGQLLNRPILLNVRYPILGNLFRSRPEIDGMAIDERGVIAVEVKSFALSHSDIEQILTKYHTLAFRRLVIVAPRFPVTKIHRATFDSVELVAYSPDEQPISGYYATWCDVLPPATVSSLSSGCHSFRYVMSRAFRKGKAVFNQVDKRICHVDDLRKDIARFRAPVSKVLWSPTRWSNPKDLFFPNPRATQFFGGFLVIDIDGTALHQSMHPCELLPGDSLCLHCIRRATIECQRAILALRSHGLEAAFVCKSGNRGFHIYVHLDTDATRSQVVEIMKANDIVYDPIVANSRKSFVAFPTSLNASTMQALDVVDTAPLSGPPEV